MDEQAFQHYLANSAVHLDESQQHQFELYYQLLVEWNEKINLTAITDRNGVYEKHFFDSITPSFYTDFKQVDSICDVGAGAGFPSLPLKICFPHIKVTIIDSLKKRINFLEHLVAELKLDGVTLVHGRAEDVGQNEIYREEFSVVIARAVANMAVLAEYCLPLCKVNGLFIALKGANLAEELKESTKAIELLGGKIEKQFDFTLPIENSDRSIVLIRKEKGTPKKYPRKAGIPNRSPIQGKANK